MQGIRKDYTTDFEEYARYSKKKAGIIVGLFSAMVVVLFLALYAHSGCASLSDLFRILINRDDPANDPIDKIIIWNATLPRVTSAVLAGAALGVAGTAMQCVLRNPLGSPYTLGISNAAAFGASVGIVILGGGAIIGQSNAVIAINNPYIVALSAFIWAMIGTGIIVFLVKITHVSAETMVLTGIAISSIFSAGISALQYIFNDYALSTIVFWQFGSMGKATPEQLYLVAITTVLVGAFFILKRWDMNALDNGTEVAKSLGMDVDGFRLVILVLSALLTAIVVSFMGIIAFVGLLGPHMIRMIVGNDHRYVIPGSMILGAIILLVSDCVGQCMFSFTLPVGIITSFLGGPMFLYLLIRGYRKKRGINE